MRTTACHLRHVKDVIDLVIEEYLIIGDGACRGGMKEFIQSGLGFREPDRLLWHADLRDTLSKIPDIQSYLYLIQLRWARAAMIINRGNLRRKKNFSQEDARLVRQLTEMIEQYRDDDHRLRNRKGYKRAMQSLFEARRHGKLPSLYEWRRQ